MNREQWLLVAGMFAAVGGMASANVHTWGETLTPQFVFSALAAISIQIRSVFTERP